MNLEKKLKTKVLTLFDQFSAQATKLIYNLFFQILSKTKQLCSPFASPADHRSASVASTVDSIVVVDQTADVRRLESLAAQNQKKKSKKGRRTGVSAIIEDIS